MLTYFLDNDLVRLHQSTPDTWEEAIWLSSQNLLGKNIITEQYVHEIIANIHRHGPYIVIIPGVALPHAAAESDGVLGTEISFTKTKNPVFFEGKDEEKSARLFFTLAAQEPKKHTNNISSLAQMLMKDGLVDALDKVETIEDYQEVAKKFDASQQLRTP